MTEKHIPRPRDPLASNDKKLKFCGPDFSKLRLERPLLNPSEALRIKEETEAEARRRWAANMGND